MREAFLLYLWASGDLKFNNYINTLRTGAFKLLKCTFLGSKQFKSTFILCFFKSLLQIR